MKYSRLLACFAAVAFAAWAGISHFSARAEEEGGPVMAGLPKAGAIDVVLLESLGPVEFAWSDKGTPRTVTGVPLASVLKHFGFDAGRHGPEVPVGEKFQGYRKILRCIARDGYEAVFTCAELDPDNGSTEAFLVWKVDGAALPAERGPFRLVVRSDKLSARSLYQLERLEVVDAVGAH